MTQANPNIHLSAYLRASTSDQNPNRAKKVLDEFASSKGLRVASWYIETASGASTDRPELLRLLSESRPDDVILIEAVDRLTRLSNEDWLKLREIISAKRLRIVSLDLPTSHIVLSPVGDPFTAAMLEAINGMLLDMLAAISRKDFETRRLRQRMGIDTAKEKGKYRGRTPDKEKHKAILKYRSEGCSISVTAKIVGVSPSTVVRVCGKNKPY